MVKINWTQLAVSDLKNVFDYIAIDSSRYAQIIASKASCGLSPTKVILFMGKRGMINIFTIMKLKGSPDLNSI